MGLTAGADSVDEQRFIRSDYARPDRSKLNFKQHGRR